MGLLPSHTGLRDLTHLLGVKQAADLTLRSRIVSTKLAFEMNLVDFLLEVASELDTLLWNVLIKSDAIQLRRDLPRNDSMMQAIIPGKVYLRHHFKSIARNDPSLKHLPGPELAVDACLCTAFYSKNRGLAHLQKCGTILQCTEPSKMLMKHWLATRDVIEVTKSVKEEVDYLTNAKKSVIVVGSLKQVAVALAVAIKRGVFSTLCGLTPEDRVKVIDEMSYLMDETSQELCLPRLGKTGDTDIEGVPSSSGYGMVAVSCEPGEQQTVKEKFLTKLRDDEQRDRSSWEWVACSEVAEGCLADLEIPFVRARFYQATMAGNPSADVEDRPEHRAVVAKVVSLGFMTFPVPPGTPMVLNTLGNLLMTALTACGGSSTYIEGALSLPPTTLPTVNTSHQSTPAHVDRFLILLTSSCLQYLSTPECPRWLTPSIIDSLFVTCFGWDPQVTPMTQFDKKKLKDSKYATEDKYLRGYFETHNSAIESHQEASPQYLTAARKLCNTFTVLPSLWDLLWPVVLYLAVSGVVMLFGIILQKWLEFRAGKPLLSYE
eukprot:TRINITY_DN18863_c0_g1_i1.p1 TRINITY_DN18863_c0_g1~~TRINITY_DN18863_c0_g1_i1.p1  ORF type:complete len:613 (+),score=140.71 TRINITY_DN18863_c0_g1_i1:202-1839(+)